MLQFIRRHPIAGLILALSLEAWLALPGEALIAVAASALVSRLQTLGRLLVGGVAGMMVNDLALFGLSRVGRGLLGRWLGLHAWGPHLSARLVMGAKFLPPLRTTAYILYGLQGVPFARFLWVSLSSSLIWIAAYTMLGRRYHGRIERWMGRWERRGRWALVAEAGLTVAALVAVWL